MITAKSAVPAAPRKSDALRSLGFPERRRRDSKDLTDRRQLRPTIVLARSVLGAQPRHPSPRVSESRNPHRGWIRFRGPVTAVVPGPGRYELTLGNAAGLAKVVIDVP